MASRNLLLPRLVRGDFWSFNGALSQGNEDLTQLHLQVGGGASNRETKVYYQWESQRRAQPLTLIFCPCQHWALLAAALMNLLLSAACSLGLLLAVSLTVANGGRRLIADCHPGLLDPLLPLDQGPGRADCPFDPTRIYVSACSSQPFCSLQVLVLPCQPPLHAMPALLPLSSPPSCFAPGYSLGSLDPFCVHVCSGGCPVWLLLRGCTHSPWGGALQEGRASGAGKEDGQESPFSNDWLCGKGAELEFRAGVVTPSILTAGGTDRP